MKALFSIFIPLFLLSCASAEHQNHQSDKRIDINYLDSHPPSAKKPVKFSKLELPDSKIWHEKIAFSPDGTELFYGQHPSGGDDYVEPTILTRTYVDGTWSTARTPDFIGDNFIGWPILSPDGNKLFMQEVSGLMYYSEKGKAGWSELKKITPNLSSQNGFGLAQLTHDDTFYFYDIYERAAYSSKFNNGKLKQVELLPYRLNPAAEFFVSRNNDYMIFNPISWGTKFYISFKHHGEWTLPMALTEYFKEDSGWDGTGAGPYVSPDEKYFFYTRWGKIFWVKTDFIEVLRQKSIHRKD